MNNVNSQYRSRSRDSRVQLDRENNDASYAKVDHFSKNRAKAKPPIPKEVLEIEEQVFKLRDENTGLKKELEATHSENEKNKAKLKAIKLYASDIQRKYDQQKIAFEELTGQDWAKRVILFKSQINQLRNDLANKESQFQDLKKRMNSLLTKEPSGAYFKAFFERQTSDLLYTKKIINEYEKRENECSKRWNELLNENLLNIEKLNGLKVQLSRQRETYQSVMAENDRRLADANDRIANSFSDHEKRKAAEFLASQIELLKEERRALLEDNDLLNVRINDLLMENEGKIIANNVSRSSSRKPNRPVLTRHRTNVRKRR